MRTLFSATFFILLFYSCNQNEKLVIPSVDNCELIKEESIERIDDYNELFSLEIPSSWKINIYQDDAQSSIYSADTTKQLTESILIDISMIRQNLILNDLFFLRQEQENLNQYLIKTNSFSTKHQKKEIHHSIFKGKKKGFPYQKQIIHIRLNNQKYIVATIELYGNQSLNKRSCKAIKIIESLKFII